MANAWHNPERGADEGSGHFRDQFFAAIVLGAEAAGLIAAKPGGMASPMAQFVKSRAMPVDRLMEIVGPRHGDIVMRRTVKGGRATDAKIGARRGNQFLGVWHIGRPRTP